MGSNGGARQVVRFGPFEANLAAGQLRRNGLKIRVQELPFRILTLLVERPGEVVTRDELQQTLWPDGTFVEFEHSLNTAVNKLRTALGDDADAPRFIETIPRRGYRFIGSVEQPSVPTPPPDAGARRWQPVHIAVVALLAVSLLANGLLWFQRGSLREDGPARRFTVVPKGDVLDAVISPDGRRIAVTTGPYASARLWIQDLNRNEPRLIAGPLHGTTASWSRDGESIAFGGLDQLFRAPVEGGLPVAVCPSSGAAQPSSSSADCARILFSPAYQGKVFEVTAQGGEASQLDLGGQEKQYAFARYLPGPAETRRIIVQEGIGTDQARIVAYDSRRRTVLVAGERPFYSPTGHILYESSGSIWALPFSPDTLEAAGESFLVARAATAASVSGDETLVYVGRVVKSQQLVWLGRDSRELGEIGQSQARMQMPSLSPARASWCAPTRGLDGRFGFTMPTVR